MTQAKTRHGGRRDAVTGSPEPIETPGTLKRFPTGASLIRAQPDLYPATPPQTIREVLVDYLPESGHWLAWLCVDEEQVCGYCNHDLRAGDGRLGGLLGDTPILEEAVRNNDSRSWNRLAAAALLIVVAVVEAALDAAE